MTLHRLNIQSGGWWMLQHHDSVDAVWGNDYDETNRPINYGARYTMLLDSDGIPIFKQVADTRGPVGQWMCWPGNTGDPGHLAQWGQVFPAILTADDPPKAKPIDTGGLAGWVTSTEFLEIAVYLPDGSTPTVGEFGLVVVGTELGDQNPLFFPGSGGSGSGVRCFQITVNNDDGTYKGLEYDEPGGTFIGELDMDDEPIEVDLFEDNDAPGVPVDQWVRVLGGPSGLWFSMPFGCAPGLSIGTGTYAGTSPTGTELNAALATVGSIAVFTNGTNNGFIGIRVAVTGGNPTSDFKVIQLT